MPIMQITDKEISLKADKVTLTLVDTTYEEQTKLIGESEGKTLETIESKNNLEAGLLSDIKNKQDEMHNKFEAYINLIKKNSLKWGFGEISVLNEHEYSYLSLGINIQPDHVADNALKNNIMQNEMYFSERRNKISAALWWLKTKWEERIKMALGDIILNITNSKVLKYQIHAGQKKLLVALALQCNAVGDVPQNDSGDFKFLRTPYLGAYSGTGDITVPIEAGALYTYSFSSTLNDLTEPLTPTDKSTVSTGSFVNANNYVWIKARFPNGMITECKYERGTASPKSPDTTAAPLSRENNNCKLTAAQKIYFNTDGSKPNLNSFQTLDVGFSYTVDTATGHEVICAVMANPLTDDMTFVPYTKFIMPYGGYEYPRTVVLVYDISDKGVILDCVINSGVVAASHTIDDMQLTLDGKSLLMKSSSMGLKVFDIEDYGVSPVYKPYDMLTLDDLIRVYN